MNGEADANVRTYLTDNAVNLSCRLDRAVGIIPVCHGRAEYAHDVIPDMALDGAAIAGHGMIDGLEESAENAMSLFRIAPGRERGIARQISEQDADLPPFTHILGRRRGLGAGHARRCGLRLDRCAASAAEAFVRVV